MCAHSDGDMALAALVIEELSLGNACAKGVLHVNGKLRAPPLRPLCCPTSHCQRGLSSQHGAHLLVDRLILPFPDKQGAVGCAVDPHKIARMLDRHDYSCPFRKLRK